MSKWIYKSVPAFSNYFNVEWTMSLIGFMIFIGCQPGMGWQMYAWKKEGSFYYPASIYPSRQLSCIHESANNIFSITTRPIESTTVIYYDDAKFSDASMFWKSQDPTENDMGNDADTIRWHSFATKKQCCNVDNFKTQDEQDKTCIAHAGLASIKDGVLHMQYSRPAHQQLPLIGRQRRQTRSGASMARGPRFFSPAVQSAPWSYESTSNDVQMMPMQDIRLTFIPGSYPICRAACSTKPQRIVSNLRVLFLQTLSIGRIWDITKGCST